jgi:hypothetical protein
MEKVNVGLDDEEFNSELGRGTIECLKAIDMGVRGKKRAIAYGPRLSPVSSIPPCLLF